MCDLQIIFLNKLTLIFPPLIEFSTHNFMVNILVKLIILHKYIFP